MDLKLTLKLNSEVISQAKIYASSQEKSLSRIIESFLRTLIDQSRPEDEANEIKITPFIKSMKTGVNIPADLDYKSDYKNHLIEKHT